MGLAWEKKKPYVWAIAVAVVAYHVLPVSYSTNILDKLMEPAINIFAITMGFIAALLPMVLSQPENRLLKSISTSKEYTSVFVVYIRQAFYLAFAATVVSALLILVNRNDPTVSRLGATLWLTIVTASVVAANRIISVLWRMLRAAVRTDDHSKRIP